MASGFLREFSTRPISSWKAELGEGPRWDPYREQLVSVDITRGILRSSSFAGGELHDNVEMEFDGFVAIAEPLSKENVLVARQNTVEWRTWDGRLLDEVQLPLPSNERMNDGTMSPWGSFVVGTMDLNGEPGVGKLWEVNRGEEPRLLREGLGIPNGLVWDMPRQRVYWVDSQAGTLSWFHVTGDSVDWTRPAESWNLAAYGGAPDGIALAGDGTIWVAKWDGYCIDVIDKNGELIGKLELPVSQPTSCVFSADGSTLFITTATYALEPDQLVQEPDAGRLFVAELR